MRPDRVTDVTETQNARHVVKKRPPAFQFYPKQWLGDDKVNLMDLDAQGAHLRLMCFAWQQTPAGTLPDDDLMLRMWAGNPKEWDRIKPQVLKAWKKRGKRYCSLGLMREYKKQKEFFKKQKAKAERRWAKPRKIDGATALPRHYHGNARAGNALQFASSSADVKEPHTPPSGALAAPDNQRQTPRQAGTNPRALGTNPRTIKQQAAAAAAKANGWKAPPAPPETELPQTHDDFLAMHAAKVTALGLCRQACDICERISAGQEAPNGTESQSPKEGAAVPTPHAQGSGIETK